MYYLLLLLIMPSILGVAYGNGDEYNTIHAGIIREKDITLEKYNASPWAAAYGKISKTDKKHRASYFSTPFGYVDINANEVADKLTHIYAEKYLAVHDQSNWYVMFSESNSIDPSQLEGICDKNIDSILGGTYDEDLLPSKTYKDDKNILIEEREICAKRTKLKIENNATYTEINTYVLTSGSTPVFLSEINALVYAFLFPVDGQKRFYIYLVRKKKQCGDYVCDEGEATCPDCISVTVTPPSETIDVNVGETVKVDVRLENTGFAPVSFDLIPQCTNCSFSDVNVSSVKNISLDIDENKTVVLNVSPHTTGTFEIKLTAMSGSHDVGSGILRVKGIKPEQQEEQPEEPGGGAGGGGTPSEENIEENKQIIKTKEGFYISWAKCISLINVFGPDKVLFHVGEEKNIGFLVQNAGTCDENVYLDINCPLKCSLSERNVALKKGEGKKLSVRVNATKHGSYQLQIIAKGYTKAKHTIVIAVYKGIREEEELNCTRELLIVSPDEIEISEGEDVNGVLISNLGSCTENVDIKVVKKVGGVEVVLDRKKIMLSPGEKFGYSPPKLAAGEYSINIKSKDVSKESKLIVKPKQPFGAIGDIAVQTRTIIIIVAIIVLIIAVIYMKYRFFT